jgi:hypothetical protein
MSIQTIRRALIASGLVLGAVAAFTPNASAGTTGSVTLGGTVTSTLTMTSVSTGGASALTLGGGASEQIVQVADISMSTNNEQGLTLTATSGDLTKAGGTAIAFQVTSVADGVSAPATGDFAIASGTDYTVQSAAAGNLVKDLYIKYTPAALQDPGNYAGSISLTVADR